MIKHYVNEICYFEPTDIAITDSSSFTYLWEFDNACKSTDFRASTSWGQPGIHTVKLTVTKTSNKLASIYSSEVKIILKDINPYLG